MRWQISLGMIVNVVSQEHCSTVYPQSSPWPQERPKTLTRLGSMMLLYNGYYQIYPTTPPPGQDLLRFANTRPFCAPTVQPQSVVVMSKSIPPLPWRVPYSSKRVREIGLDKTTHVYAGPLVHHCHGELHSVPPPPPSRPPLVPFTFDLRWKNPH